MFVHVCMYVYVFTCVCVQEKEIVQIAAVIVHDFMNTYVYVYVCMYVCVCECVYLCVVCVCAGKRVLAVRSSDGR